MALFAERAAYMAGMTHINPADAARIAEARRTNGQFGTWEPTAPEATLDPRAELDTANRLYQDNARLLVENITDYVRYAMPEGAHRVELEPSDQGDFVYVAEAFDADGQVIAIDDEVIDQWADVNDVIALLGHPDDNRALFRDLFGADDHGTFTWTRQGPTNDADEQTIRERIDRLTTARQEIAAASQEAAVLAVRRMLPDGAQARLTWGDQPGPDYLCVDAITLADGTELDADEAFDAGIDWDEIDMAASDIRNTTDPALTPRDNRGLTFTLHQKAS